VSTRQAQEEREREKLGTLFCQCLYNPSFLDSQGCDSMAILGTREKLSASVAQALYHHASSGSYFTEQVSGGVDIQNMVVPTKGTGSNR
jgi:hypothetical protein